MKRRADVVGIFPERQHHAPDRRRADGGRRRVAAPAALHADRGHGRTRRAARRGATAPHTKGRLTMAAPITPENSVTLTDVTVSPEVPLRPARHVRGAGCRLFRALGTRDASEHAGTDRARACCSLSGSVPGTHSSLDSRTCGGAWSCGKREERPRFSHHPLSLLLDAAPPPTIHLEVFLWVKLCL